MPFHPLTRTNDKGQNLNVSTISHTSYNHLSTGCWSQKMALPRHSFKPLDHCLRDVPSGIKNSGNLLPQRTQIQNKVTCLLGLPGSTSGKEPACQCRRWKRQGFNPWVGKILWRRALQPTPIFLPEESYELRSLRGTVHRVAELDMTKVT